ncbi:MAG TPA: Uma2 family endonuclease [Gemmataceae bacterium]|nr:Uma2 family endonuclease [Gemmataceae bacterium]
MNEMRIIDEGFLEDLIQARRKNESDAHDELWNGVYVVSPLANNDHQDLICDLIAILREVIKLTGRGRVQPGANVSDRTGEEWMENFRVPDVVVALNGGRAVEHWEGGPDFLVDVQSPGDETDAKIPFCGRIGIRELLIIHRDKRRLRLFRNDGTELLRVEPDAKKWLTSAVVPPAFRRTTAGKKPPTEVRRTDGTPGRWVV